VILKFENAQNLALTMALMLISPLVLAAPEKTPWTTYFILGTTVSLVVAYVCTIRQKSAESLAVKILLGGLYFWVATFIQLTVVGAIYYFDND
jgi:hypothetical protein